MPCTGLLSVSAQDSPSIFSRDSIRLWNYKKRKKKKIKITTTALWNNAVFTSLPIPFKSHILLEIMTADPKTSTLTELFTFKTRISPLTHYWEIP